METTEYEDVVSLYDITKLPVSITTTDVNLTGSWKFYKPVISEKLSPCTIACPSNINIPKYIMYLVKGDLKTALDILREENPLPAVCGRVCPHFCQFECNRSEYDGAVSIKEIEKFLGDYGLNIPFGKVDKNINKKIAIVGSGPAGLSTAYFLKKAGLNITIFEKFEKLGGLLRYGIPEYRLPKAILDKEIENIIKMGIEVRTGYEVNHNNLKELEENFDVIFIATGLWKARIPSNITIDNKYFFSGLDFLKDINSGKTILKNKEVAIIGGGNVAIDVARTLLRYGNKPQIIYRRTIDKMPAFRDEIEDAMEEDINIIEKTVIKNFIIENSKIKVTLAKVNNKLEISNDLSDKYFDAIVFAIGQKAFIEFEKSSKVFLGGDLSSGAATVTEAIASGKLSAFKILKYLGILDKSLEKNPIFRAAKDDYYDTKVVSFEQINTFYFKKQPPINLEKLDVEVRKTSFEEVYKIRSLEDIVKEASRCFNCGICNKCGTCWFNCPDVSVNYSKDFDEPIDFDYEHCKGCGVCSNECPRGVIDMIEDK